MYIYRESEPLSERATYRPARERMKTSQPDILKRFENHRPAAEASISTASLPISS